MDPALDSVVNVQSPPNLPFSPRSTLSTLVSPTVSPPDTSNLPPPADPMSSSEPSSPITAPESPIVPEAALPALLNPPSSDAAVDTAGPELFNARSELAEAQRQLALVRAQLLEFQEHSAHIRERQTQSPETLNSDPDLTHPQQDEHLEVQLAPTEPQGSATTAQDTPSTGVEPIPQLQTTETSPDVPAEADRIAPEVDISQLAAEEPSTEEPSTEEPSAEEPSAEEPSAEEPSAEEPQQDGEVPPPIPSQEASDDYTRPSSPPAVAIAGPPEWVDIEEDTSFPDDDELKEIEAQNDISARDVKYHEESFYADAPDDPEQQPLQKMRLTWVIKGVRGTREKPNEARIMNSPAVLVGGFYWYLKFFPRGNNSSALSAYVKCSRKEPKPDKEVPENTFSVVYGAPDADLGELTPAIDVSIPATSVTPKEASKPKEDGSSAEETEKKNTDGDVMQQDESANASADSAESPEDEEEDEEEDGEDWRVSAQIGIIIYNPDEPRTKFDMGAFHQFNKHNDDWGWTNFHGPWSEIHKRRRGQRQALLRNDTIALDAYVRIFNDPSEALWWHSCGAEEQWDSMSLAGYPAVGTRFSYNQAVAGITSWLLLAPFRRIFQNLETDRYRNDSRVRPQSLCSQLQMILYLMRKQKKDEKFVSLQAIVDIMEKLDELGTDVVTFWEGFRRSLELELGRNQDAIDQIADIFDSAPAPGPAPGPESVSLSPLRIPVEDVPSIQSGIERTFAQVSGRRSFPKFLTVELERQKFDTSIREWKLVYDRVRLSEELDLSQWSVTPETSMYTLYGFVVHADERTSERFYSILRPNGPGSKWLAFEDGQYNQVISYTKHKIQEFEGLEGDALKENKATRRTAYLAMYIRTDLLGDFLPGALEPYELSPWLRNCPQVKDNIASEDVVPYEEEIRCEVKVEIYSSQRAKGQRGLIDIHDLRGIQACEFTNPPQFLTVPADTTCQELRQKLAKWNGIENVEKIKLWAMQPPSPGAALSTSFTRISMLHRAVRDKNSATRSLCIWMHILGTDEDVRRFGDPEPDPDYTVFDRPAVEERRSDSQAHETPESADEVAAERETSSNEDAQLGVGTQSNDPSLLATGPPMSSTWDAATWDAGQDTIRTTEIPVTVEIEALPPASTEEPTPGGDTRETASPIAVVRDEDMMAAAPDGVLARSQEPAEQQSELQAQPSPASPSVPADVVPGQPTADAAPSTTLSPEDESAIAALIAQDLEDSEAVDGESPEADVVMPGVLAESADVPVDAAAGAVGETPGATASELPLAEQQEAERQEAENSGRASPAAGEVTNDDAQSDSSLEEEITSGRPVPFYYGFIQIFDAQAQEFLIHGDFIATAIDDVKVCVRRQLGYAHDKNFSVWRRANNYRLTTVPASSTFQDFPDSRDGFVLVVGEVLSEAAKSSLSSISSFPSPGPLSRYLWFSARHHPVKAHTGHITISSFGADYYSGNLVKGLYSGLGTHITPTGHSYTGPFLAGCRWTSEQHSEGTCTYSNGDTYTGGWANDERHGQGVFVEKRTGNKYVGGYQEGKRWGKGVTYWEVADEEGEMCQICYGEGVDALFYDCGHVCACVGCARQVSVCPICRETVKGVVKMWKA